MTKKTAKTPARKKPAANPPIIRPDEEFVVEMIELIELKVMEASKHQEKELISLLLKDLRKEVHMLRQDTEKDLRKMRKSIVKEVLDDVLAEVKPLLEALSATLLKREEQEALDEAIEAEETLSKMGEDAEEMLSNEANDLNPNAPIVPSLEEMYARTQRIIANREKEFSRFVRKKEAYIKRCEAQMMKQVDRLQKKL